MQAGASNRGYGNVLRPARWGSSLVLPISYRDGLCHTETPSSTGRRGHRRSQVAQVQCVTWDILLPVNYWWTD